MSGGVMADPTCVPGSTYTSPFVGKGLHDIHDDRSISALYFYPKQLEPHKSILLKDVVRGPPRLTAEDQENTRRRSRGRGGFNNSDHRHGGSYGIGGYDSRPMQYGAPSHRSYNGYGGSGYSRGAYSSHGGSGRGGGYTPSNGGYGGRGGESGQGYHGGRGGGGYSHSSRGGPPRGRW
ncbi:hypothetical protein DL93DRAFT_1165392 [Clavulina sp. PMI_390]|nr:hypothetical protein DL93DRAFT_1165392 [Clavulina sp. PMI_390]